MAVCTKPQCLGSLNKPWCPIRCPSLPMTNVWNPLAEGSLSHYVHHAGRVACESLISHLHHSRYQFGQACSTSEPLHSLFLFPRRFCSRHVQCLLPHPSLFVPLKYYPIGEAFSEHSFTNQITPTPRAPLPCFIFLPGTSQSKRLSIYVLSVAIYEHVNFRRAGGFLCELLCVQHIEPCLSLCMSSVNIS